MSLSAQNPKRQKTQGDGDAAVYPAAEQVGPDQLRSWVADKSIRFDPSLRKSLISSPNIHAIDILDFVVRYVFEYSWVERHMDNEEFSAVGHLKRTDRIKVLGLVTMWLGQSDSGGKSSIPTLAQLSAQRIAMDMFYTFIPDLDRQFENKNFDYFKDTLRGEMTSQLNDRGVPENWHGVIVEELLIFATVYFLYIDLRTMTNEPYNEECLKLPVGRHRDDCWWDNYGQHDVVNCVPDYGRGRLAKVGLLPHAVQSSYRRRHMGNDFGSYGHIEVIQMGMFYRKEGSLIFRHPFANSSALAPIASLVHAFLYSEYGYSECWDLDVEETLIPWMEEVPGLTQYDESSYAFLCLATNLRRRNYSPVVSELAPFSLASCQETVQDCLNAWDAKTFLGHTSPCEDDAYVTRLRMNGDYSKEEILYAAMISARAELVDLEHCICLDEECLELVLVHLVQVKVVLLKGTRISKHSDVIKNADKERDHKIKFVFSDACKCCGRCGSIKTLKFPDYVAGSRDMLNDLCKPRNNHPVRK